MNAGIIKLLSVFIALMLAIGAVALLSSTGTGPPGGGPAMAVNLVALAASAGLLIAAGYLVDGGQDRR